MAASIQESAACEAAPPPRSRSEQSRINGARSRGPVTAEGRARSARSALRHGMISPVHLCVRDEEDPSVFNTLHAQLLNEHCPDTIHGCQLVQRLAVAYLQRDRADRVQAELFAAGRDGHGGLKQRHDLELMLRYANSAQRQIARCAEMLEHLRQRPLQGQLLVGDLAETIPEDWHDGPPPAPMPTWQALGSQAVGGEPDAQPPANAAPAAQHPAPGFDPAPEARPAAARSPLPNETPVMPMASPDVLREAGFDSRENLRNEPEDRAVPDIAADCGPAPKPCSDVAGHEMDAPAAAGPVAGPATAEAAAAQGPEVGAALAKRVGQASGRPDLQAEPPTRGSAEDPAQAFAWKLAMLEWLITQRRDREAAKLFRELGLGRHAPGQDLPKAQDTGQDAGQDRQPGLDGAAAPPALAGRLAAAGSRGFAPA